MRSFSRFLLIFLDYETFWDCLSRTSNKNHRYFLKIFNSHVTEACDGATSHIYGHCFQLMLDIYYLSRFDKTIIRCECGCRIVSGSADHG